MVDLSNWKLVGFRYNKEKQVWEAEFDHKLPLLPNGIFWLFGCKTKKDAIKCLRQNYNVSVSHKFY